MASRSILPALPAIHRDFIKYVAGNSKVPMVDILKPYRDHDTKIRELFAQEPNNPVLEDDHLNVVPVFDGDTSDLKIRARDLSAESDQEKQKYVMSLKDEDRKPAGTPAVVQSIKDFRHNFGVFTESSLSDLDWNNVVAAGSSVVTSLLPVPKDYQGSRRALREYYHQVVAPASDVDLFLYGLTEEEAVEKIKQIESKVRDSILEETTTIRTKHAITIASQYPVRHIQIVLRIYKSVSEILTGFDVDCSCAAYDGKQVWASPRALAAYMTQINHVDLSRRSPSYENRLSKYSHRGFEIYWPLLDRTKIDPTIFERSFQRTLGLARLLVLEKLPHSQDRANYTDKRRAERGRPALDRYNNFSRFQHGNIKAGIDDEVAEWVDEEEVSDYHTFTVPYGEKFTAKRIEKLLYAKDLLLNAEWNKPKDREVNLHRHPAFFGSAADVIEDCCGYCPKPTNIEEEDKAEEEGKVYVSGAVSFIKDNPGRQTIGSFNPVTDDDWTEMAYVGNTARLCQAIVDGDLEHVEDWLAQEGSDPNRRDYTGRTPLHLAVMVSTAAIVKALINANARLVARLADGRTALHLAAARGDVEIISAIMIRSEANEAEEEEKKIIRRSTKSKETAATLPASNPLKRSSTAISESRQNKSDVEDDGDESDEVEESDSDHVLHSEDGELIDAESTDDGVMSVSTQSFVKVKKVEEKKEDLLDDAAQEDEPDFYDVNVLSWDHPSSPLHLAILNGHTEAVKTLCSTFGADVLLPIKLVNGYDKSPKAAILTLVLALSLPEDYAKAMIKTLLDLGATPRQADLNGITAFHFFVQHSTAAAQALAEFDIASVKAVINHIAVSNNWYSVAFITPLLTALERRDADVANQLLDLGAKIKVEFAAFMKAAKARLGNQVPKDTAQHDKKFGEAGEQPLCLAIIKDLPDIAVRMLNEGADANTLTAKGHLVLNETWHRSYRKGQTALDIVQEKLRHLRQYTGEKRLNNYQVYYNAPPIALKGAAYYLAPYKPGTYQLQVAEKQYLKAKKQYEDDLVEYNREQKGLKAPLGVTEKKTAIKEMIGKFEKLEKLLKSKGAKLFTDMHPKIEAPARQKSYDGYQRERGIFEIKFSFGVLGFDDELRQPYVDLFEAAWSGNTNKIRELTTQPQGANQDRSPLTVSGSDGYGSTIFSLAVERGHLDTATAILEICQTQYVPPEKRSQKYRMSTRDSDYDDSEDNENDEDDLDIESIKADDAFTTDNAGEVSLKVESDTSPLDLLRTGHSFGEHSKTLLQHAIAKDDLKLLDWLLDTAQKYTTARQQQSPDDNLPHAFSIDVGTFNAAIASGNTKMLATILSKTAAGLPLDDLVKKAGATITEKPRYYQGLSVHGKKRADWAMAGREQVVEKTSGTSYSPLLIATEKRSIESLQWFMSDAPMRHYKEFAARFGDDKRLQQLSKASGGFEKAVAKWLNTRSYLLPHCAVLAKPSKEADDLLQYILQVMPQNINKKNKDGYSALHIAFSLRRVNAAKMLIAAGADQRTKDANYYNILHALLTPIRDTRRDDVRCVAKLMDMLDPKVRAELIKARTGYSAGSATPFHAWIERTVYNDSFMTYSDLPRLRDHQNSLEEKQTLLKLWLGYSQGEDLGIIDGSGETPLHTLVKNGKRELSELLMQVRPDLLFRENATGRTPYEIAWDKYSNSVVSQQNSLGTEGAHRYTYNDNDRSIEANAPETFLPDHKGSENDLLLMWQLCQKVAEKHPGKRYLVTLNDANEVARRLAESNRSSTNKGYGPTGAKLSIVRGDKDTETKAQGSEADSDAMSIDADSATEVYDYEKEVFRSDEIMDWYHAAADHRDPAEDEELKPLIEKMRKKEAEDANMHTHDVVMRNAE